MQRLEQRSPERYTAFLYHWQTVDITMPVFALLALVAYSVSLALIVPGLLQKKRLAANGYFSAVVALVCHAIALKPASCPTVIADKTSAC